MTEDTNTEENKVTLNEEETKLDKDINTDEDKVTLNVNENICQPKNSSGGSLFIKFIASAAFIFACISLVVSFVNTKGLSRQISSLDSKIWSLGLRTDKIDNEVRSFNNNVAVLEGKMTDFEKTIVVAELKRVFSTVRDISRRSSDRVREYANVIGENITGLIHDLEEEISKPKDEPILEPESPHESQREDLKTTQEKSEFLAIPMEKPVNIDEIQILKDEGESAPFGEVNIEPGEQGHSEQLR